MFSTERRRQFSGFDVVLCTNVNGNLRFKSLADYESWKMQDAGDRRGLIRKWRRGSLAVIDLVAVINDDARVKLATFPADETGYNRCMEAAQGIFGIPMDPEDSSEFAHPALTERIDTIFELLHEVRRLRAQPETTQEALTRLKDRIGAKFIDRHVRDCKGGGIASNRLRKEKEARGVVFA